MYTNILLDSPVAYEIKGSRHVFTMTHNIKNYYNIRDHTKRQCKNEWVFSIRKKNTICATSTEGKGSNSIDRNLWSYTVKLQTLRQAKATHYSLHERSRREHPKKCHF